VKWFDQPKTTLTSLETHDGIFVPQFTIHAPILMHMLDRQPNNRLQWVWDPVQSFKLVQLLS